MAQIHYRYRSKKDNATLELRLQHRIHDLPSTVKVRNSDLYKNVPYTDILLSAKTPILIYSHEELEENTKLSAKSYWSKHSKTRQSIEITNKQDEVKDKLNKLSNFILEAFNKTNAIDVDKKWLEHQIHLYYNPPIKKPTIPTNLIDYIDYYINNRKPKVTADMVKKFNVVKHKLQRMEKARNSIILIKDINEDFQEEFAEYQETLNYSQNTIQRDLGYIKTFCIHARSKGLDTDPSLDSLKLEKEETEKIYLTFDELDAIQEMDFEDEYLDNARDWLIISCYTGQRISDFMRLSKDMISQEAGDYFLEFTQKKTKHKVSIKVHNKVLEILKKRNGDLPRVISDQRYNDYIKEVCKAVGANKELKEGATLNKKVEGGKSIMTDNGMRKVYGMYPKHELVTSHVGRRSFVSNYYDILDIVFIMNVTGHKRESTFRDYVQKSSREIAKNTNYTR